MAVQRVRTPGPIVQVGRRAISAFQICAGIGLMVCLTLAMLLTVQQQLAVAVTVVLACAGLLAFLVLTMVTKIITGEEALVYYHHEIAVLTVAAALLWLTRQPILAYLDATLLGVGMFLACGRVGCLMVGCCHGRPHRWGVRYRGDHVVAGFRPCFAASAVRTFERTATFIPMKPAAAERTAPIRNPTAVPQPSLS